MDIGLFADMRNPVQWERPWDRFYPAALEQLEEADRLGIDSVWLTEHHFFDDGYLTQPLTFAAAIAARTSRMRIGTAILIAGLREAVDIAEQAVVVDHISGGRTELGLGAGYRIPEFTAFGADASRRFELLEERAAAVKHLWEDEDSPLTPRPLQAKAPLWIGAHGPRGARIAGRLGAGLLSFAPEVLEPYQDALEASGHGRGSARLADCANLILSDDPEAAWPRIAPHLGYQWSSYARYGAEGAEGADTGAAALEALAEDVDPESLRSSGPEMFMPSFDVVTPDEAVRRVRAWLDGKPVQTVYWWLSIAGMPDDIAERHLELLAGVVRPALRGDA